MRISSAIKAENTHLTDTNRFILVTLYVASSTVKGVWKTRTHFPFMKARSRMASGVDMANFGIKTFILLVNSMITNSKGS